MNTEAEIPRLALFPGSAGVNAAGHLTLGGCDAVALAGEFDTPLYVFDEGQIRAMCAEFRREFSGLYPDTGILYAGKAFTAKALQ